MTYSERSKQLALDSSIAVLVLSDPDCMDVELLMLAPRQLPEAELVRLGTVWHGRNLKSIGVLGLVNGTAKCEFRVPLETGRVCRLAEAFAAYIHQLVRESLAAQQEIIEIEELSRMWSLADPRSEVLPHS